MRDMTERRIEDPKIFIRPAMELAPYLAGKLLCRDMDGRVERLRITETEAYLGEFDTAAHARHGRTARTEPLYQAGGTLYVYLCYGIHSLLNIITGPENEPQGVLIRCCEGAEGPGKLTKVLGIDLSYNGLDILVTDRISLWKGPECAFEIAPRVGIGYASREDQLRPWRFIRKGGSCSTR